MALHTYKATEAYKGHVEKKLCRNYEIVSRNYEIHMW